MYRWLAALLGLTLSLGVAAAQEQDFTTLKGHGGPIMALGVTPEDRVVSASFDNALGHWDGQTPQWLDGHAAAVTSLAIGPQGQIASGSDDFAVLLWEQGAARELGRHKGKVMGLAFSPDGRQLASASWDGSVVIWSLGGEGAREVAMLDASVNAVAFDQTGGILFVATSKGDIWRYDLSREGSRRPLVRHGFGVNRLELGDGWLAYGAVDGGTRLIDPDSGKALADFTLDRRPILALSYHAQTQRLAVGDGEGYIMMIDTAEMRIAQDFRATRRGPIWALAFSQDGQRIWAGGVDDVVYGWPVALLGEFDAVGGETRSFLRAPETMSNGERQFMRKCSICHSLEGGASRKAGPTLHGVFGRRAGTVAGYRYSNTLDGSDIVWNAETIDALFDQGPDHYIPGSKMPMQVIAKPDDRADLIAYLKEHTKGE